MTRKVQGIRHPSAKVECFHCHARATLAIVTTADNGARIGYLPVCSGYVLASHSN